MSDVIIKEAHTVGVNHEQAANNHFYIKWITKENPFEERMFKISATQLLAAHIGQHLTYEQVSKKVKEAVAATHDGLLIRNEALTKGTEEGLAERIRLVKKIEGMERDQAKVKELTIQNETLKAQIAEGTKFPGCWNNSQLVIYKNEWVPMGAYCEIKKLEKENEKLKNEAVGLLGDRESIVRSWHGEFVRDPLYTKIKNMEEAHDGLFSQNRSLQSKITDLHRTMAQVRDHLGITEEQHIFEEIERLNQEKEALRRNSRHTIAKLNEEKEELKEAIAKYQHLEAYPSCYENEIKALKVEMDLLKSILLTDRQETILLQKRLAYAEGRMPRYGGE